MEVIIGPYLAISDPKLLNNLWASVGWKKKSEESWKNYLGFIEFVYTAMDRGVPVGMGTGVGDGVDCYVIDVCVHPAYQGRNVGLGIVQRLVDTARARGYRSAKLAVPEANQDVRGFYEKAGFQRREGLNMELTFRH